MHLCVEFRRGEVGVDYNDPKNIEYTKYKRKGICDGYFIEVPNDPKYASGATITVFMDNTTRGINIALLPYTYVTGGYWQTLFIPTAANRIALRDGRLEISYEIALTSGTFTYISIATVMTAVAP